MEEWLEPELLSKLNWLGFFESLKILHALNDEKDLQRQDKLRERIAFDELLANQDQTPSYETYVLYDF